MDTERNKAELNAKFGAFGTQGDGERAGDIMSGGIVAEFHTRLTKLEAENADLRDALNGARNSGAVPYPGFVEHVAHVMSKYHAGDKPDGFDEKYPIHGREISESEFSLG